MRRALAALCVATFVGAACAGGGGVDTVGGGNVASTSQEARPSTTRPTETTTSLGATTTVVPPPPQHGGSVVIAEDQEPATLNPFAPGGDVSVVTIIGQAHLAGAFDIAAGTLELIPELVTELPTVANGGVVINDDGTMTVSYEIRDEAVWSDGVPIDGRDFEFTLGLMLDEEVSGDRWAWMDVVDTAVRSKTFELTLRQPSVMYEQLFETIVPRHAVVGTDILNDWNDTIWPSAGPFVLADWQHGESLTLVRNDRYWKVDEDTGARLPYLDSVEFRFIPETTELVQSFRRHDVDVIQPPPAAAIVDELTGLESAGADVQVLAGPVWEHLNFQYGPNNRNPESLNRFASYRQAVAYAVNPEVVASAVNWVPIYSILDQEDVEGPWAQYEFNLDRAAELLADACDQAKRDCGVDPPRAVFSTTSNAEERPRIAELLVGMLGRIGIEVELQLEDSQLYFGETLPEGTWDVGWWAWVTGPGAAGTAGVLDLFDPDAPPPDGSNFYRWGTTDSVVSDEAVARYRDVLAILHETVDPAEIRSLAEAAEQILADNAVVVPVASRRVVGAVWADEIGGYQLNTSRAGHTWNIETWHRLVP